MSAEAASAASFEPCVESSAQRERPASQSGVPAEKAIKLPEWARALTQHPGY